MSSHKIQRQKYGKQAMVYTLALLILLCTGCTEKEATAPEDAAPIQASSPQVAKEKTEPAQAPSPQIAEPEAPPPAEATDSNAIVDTKHADSSPQQIPESAGASSTLEMNESHGSRSNQITTEGEKAFDPSHIVMARLNLRPSASLNTTPIAVLNVGEEVEYIRKSDGWYYVNTKSHGKGWCSSDYLSPLSSTQRKSSAK